MSQVLECPMCTGQGFSMHYVEARPAWQFLWWHRAAQPASITLWCLNCDFEWKGHAPGSVVRDPDILKGRRILAS